MGAGVEDERALEGQFGRHELAVPAHLLQTPADDVTDSPTDKDRLTGGSGRDWFIVSTNDKVLDSGAGDYTKSF